MSEKIKLAPDWKRWKSHLIVCVECTAGNPCADGRTILGAAKHDDAPWLDKRSGEQLLNTGIHGPDNLGHSVATANAALSDDDPGKITMARIELLRDAASDLREIQGWEHPNDERAGEEAIEQACADADALDAFADALELYLPPL